MSNLQILINPMYSKKELNADSNYVLLDQMIRYCYDNKFGHHFWVVFPSLKSGYFYVDDGLFDLPNVTRIALDISTNKFINARAFNATWYAKLFSQIGVDIIWNHLVEIGGHLLESFESPGNEEARPVVISSHHYIIHDSLPNRGRGQTQVRLSQLTGALLSDFHVFNSRHCRNMFYDNAVRYLSKTVCDTLANKERLIHLGVIDGIFDSYNASRKATTPVFAYNHRLQGYKRFKDTFEVFKGLYEKGIKFKVKVFVGSNDNLGVIRHYPFVEIMKTPKREDYLRELSTCHLNTLNSVHETFCIAAVESMAMGQPLITPNGVTFPEITGQSETKYPYLFHTKKQQSEMLETLLLSQDERVKWGEILKKYVTTNFTKENFCQQYLALFESEYQKKKIQIKPIVVNCLKQSSGKSLRELRASMIKRRRDFPTFGSQSLTLPKLLLMLRQVGMSVDVRNNVQFII